MTAATIREVPVTDLPVSVQATENGLLLRWDGHEVALEAQGDELHRYVEALRFCYQAGLDDASNPRFFVP